MVSPVMAKKKKNCSMHFEPPPPSRRLHLPLAENHNTTLTKPGAFLSPQARTQRKYLVNV